MRAPCHGCDQRTPECHCSCVLYEEFVRLCEIKRRLWQLENMINSHSPAFERSILRREQKRKRGRKD